MVDLDSACEKFEIDISEDTKTLIFKLNNSRPHPVDARCAINDSTGLFAFPDGMNTNFTVISEIGYRIEVTYKNPGDTPPGNFSFGLIIESKDKITEPKRSDEYNSGTWRTEYYPIKICISERGSLTFSKQAISFSENLKTAAVRLHHAAGTSNIKIKSALLPRGFNVASSSRGGNVLEDESLTHSGPQSFIDLTLEYTGGFDKKLYEPLTITYTSSMGDEKLSLPLYVVHKSKAFAEGDIPERIVAVDFGTSKTVVVFIDLFDNNGRKYEEHELVPRLVEFNLGFEKRTAYPSVISIDEHTGHYKFGLLAENDTTNPRLEHLKMYLLHDKVYFTGSALLDTPPIEKETKDVLCRYLLNLYEALPSHLKDNKANQYVFTLPVLDKENANSPDYDKQKAITLKCAQFAGFGNARAIHTLTESDAALKYVLYKWRKNDFSLPEQPKNGDVIAVLDCGAGTLDVTLGMYEQQLDGKFSMKVLGRIGKFGAEAVTLGGNRIDIQTGVACVDEAILQDEANGPEQPSAVIEFRLISDDGKHVLRTDPDRKIKAFYDMQYNLTPAYDDEGVLLDFFKFSMNSTVYPNYFRTFYTSYFTKPAKELVSFSDPADANELYMNGVNVYSDNSSDSLSQNENYLMFDIDSYSKVIQKQAEMMSAELHKITAEKSIDTIQHVFMVGGSSLLRCNGQGINDYLLHDLIIKGVKNVFTPFDYTNFSFKDKESINYNTLKQVDNRKKIRDAAICAVAMGAALDNPFKLHTMFHFDIVIRKKDATQTFDSYKTGDVFSSDKIKRMYSDDVNGEWGVYGIIDAHEVLLDDFVLAEPPGQIIWFKASVSEGVLKVYCNLGNKIEVGNAMRSISDKVTLKTIVMAV
jgi:hypothetical protein